MGAANRSEDDFIDKVRREWKRAYPEFDTAPVEVMGRIARINAQSLHQLDRALASSGVSRAEFDVMSALARSDRPLRASEVTAVTMVSGAATTKHADRLAKLALSSVSASNTTDEWFCFNSPMPVAHWSRQSFPDASSETVKYSPDSTRTNVPN